MESDGMPNPAQRIEQDGTVWELIETTSAPDPDWKAPSTHLERIETVECEPADLDATLAAYPESMEVEQDGVSGEIPRVSLDSEAVWVQQEYQVDRVYDYAGLPDNDSARLDGERSFLIEETGNAVTLRLAGVQWEPEAVDGATGLPSSWTARALYRGTDVRNVVDRYVVTAVYSGDVSDDSDVLMVQTALYEAVPEPEPELEPAFPWPAVAAGGAAAVIVGGVLVWWRSRDVKVVENAGNGTYKVVTRVRSKTSAPKGAREVVVPSRLDLGSKRYLLVLRPDAASAPRFVAVHLGETIYDGPGKQNIDLLR